MTLFSGLCFWCQMIVYAMWGAAVWLIGEGPIWAKILASVILVGAMIGTVQAVFYKPEGGSK